MSFFVRLSCFLFFSGSVFANPFTINFPEKNIITNEDYINIQDQISKINIEPLLQELYRKDQELVSIDDFRSRCSRGITQTIIDPKNGLYPVNKLVKIGKGGDNCVVTFCSISGKYSDFVKSTAEALEKVGFNGYFYYQIGGFPNPTGKEIKYVGVPYCFKIFTMLEAQKLGFNKVLWIDSTMLPLRDLTPIFTQIEEKGCFLLDFTNHNYNKARIFQQTYQLLKDLTGTDVVNMRHIATGILGLKMDTNKAKEFVSSYYKFVELGTPFLSCFPEEMVFAALFGQNPSEWPSQYIHSIIRYTFQGDVNQEIAQATRQGLYFYLRPR